MLYYIRIHKVYIQMSTQRKHTHTHTHGETFGRDGDDANITRNHLDLCTLIKFHWHSQFALRVAPIRFLSLGECMRQTEKLCHLFIGISIEMAHIFIVISVCTLLFCVIASSFISPIRWWVYIYMVVCFIFLSSSLLLLLLLISCLDSNISLDYGCSRMSRLIVLSSWNERKNFLFFFVCAFLQ